MTSSPINRSMSPHEWGMILVLSLLWGGSFFFTGIAVKELPPFTIVALRVGLAALILNMIVRAMGLRMPQDAGVWAAFFGMGFLNNVVPFTLIVWGQTHIASGLASILNATAPLFTVIVAQMLTTDEKMTRGRLAGVIIGFLGVVVMIGLAALHNLGTNIVAQLACLAAAICYAFAAVFGRRFKILGVAPMPTATGQLTASSIILIPAALLIDQPWKLAVPSLSTWGALVGIAVLSTALAYILYFRILATAGATNIQLVTFLIPVSAILLGSFVLGERLDPTHFAGMGLIGLGLAAIDGRLLRFAVSRKRNSRRDVSALR